ncbi:MULTISPECIES: phytanoyl-CoA dioxygenase [Streptomyces]|uniref:phytanoyl-CoA dioxygenase n=1 Tax=Streptomyces TaxID=1883 RepID=UPI001F2F21A6|nr:MULTISPECIES: phytanoyl-CoA dioxygenase [Streptomyces]
MTLSSGGPETLDIENHRQFLESGYLVLPGLVPESLRERLVPEVDRWVDGRLRARSIAACADPARHAPPPLLELELPAHGQLLTHPPLLWTLTRLLGPSFVFHHLHSDRQEPGIPGKPWHHDCEPNDRSDASLLMVHALHYLGGLDEKVGSLSVLPGSHRGAFGKSAFAHHGTAELPGEVVIDRLPPGSTVLLNSALFHTRRPAPDGPAPVLHRRLLLPGRRALAPGEAVLAQDARPGPAAEHGLLLLLCGIHLNVVRMIPALVVTAGQVDEALELWTKAVAAGSR